MKKLPVRWSIIAYAEKGGSVVIVDNKNYVAECKIQLNDTHSYDKRTMANDKIERFKNAKFITKNIAQKLNTTSRSFIQHQKFINRATQAQQSLVQQTAILLIFLDMLNTTFNLLLNRYHHM